MTLLVFALVAIGCSDRPTEVGTIPVQSPSQSTSTVSATDTVTDLAGADGSGLPEAHREYLWEVEHRALLLKKYGLKRLTKAIAHEEWSSIQQAIAADCRFHVPKPERSVEIEEAFGRVRRDVFMGQDGPTAAGGGDFLAWLQQLRRQFHSCSGFSASVIDGSPLDPGQLDQDWRAVWTLSLQGTAADRGPIAVDLLVEITTAAPTKDLFQKGGWLRDVHVRRRTWGSSQRLLMQPVEVDRGIDTSQLHDNQRGTQVIHHTGGVYACDFDRDGCIDLLLNDYGLGNKWGIVLYQGSPDGQFDDVTESMGLDGISAFRPIVIADLNNDGWEDLVLGPGGVFANDHGKKFRNVTRQSNLNRPENLGSRAGSIAVADYDCDGLLDLYVSLGTEQSHNQGSWLGGPSPDARNRLLRNRGFWRFENVTRKTGADGGEKSTFNSVWLDANDDGWPDLYVTDEFGNGTLLVNHEGQEFEQRSLVEDQDDFGTMGLTAGDFDNDGRTDLYLSNMYSRSGQRVMRNLPTDAYSPDVMRRLHSLVAGSQLYRNVGGRQFEAVGDDFLLRSVGWSWGACFADWNNDGFLDIYATCGFISRDRNKPDG